MGRAYIAFALANPAVYGLMFRQGATVMASPHLKSASTTAWQQLCDGVGAAIGSQRSSETPAKAAAIWALVHGTATLILDRKLPGPASGKGEADVTDAILSSLPGILGVTLPRPRQSAAIPHSRKRRS